MYQIRDVVCIQNISACYVWFTENSISSNDDIHSNDNLLQGLDLMLATYLVGIAL